MYETSASKSGERHFTVPFVFLAALLLAFVGTSAASAPISPGYTSSYNQAQLAYQQLGLFAPVDMQAGSPFFAPIDRGIVTTTPLRPPPDLPALATYGGATFSSFSGVTLSIIEQPGTGPAPDDLPDGRPGNAIPEPAGALLFGAGFALVALRARRPSTS